MSDLSSAPLVLAQDGEGTIPVGEHVTAQFLGMTLNLDTIWATAIAGAIVLALGFWFRAKMTSEVPGRVQMIWETLLDWVHGQTKDQLGRLNPFVVPLAASLFIFILVANWLEVIPSGEDPKFLPAPTSDVNLVFPLAIIVLVGAHIFGLMNRGWGYFRHYKNPIELITELSKYLSLPLRLFGNMLAGGLMIGLLALLPVWLLWAPTAAWKLFDMFIGALQAFIFAILTIVYWGQLGGPEQHADRSPAPSTAQEEAAAH